MADDKATVLIVDDVPETLEIIQRNLSSLGHNVYTAPGVLEAIEILESTSVDLVITDLKMPRISGLDLVRHVRENMKDTEIIMMTGYATVGGAVEAVKTGAEEYLPKPFTDEELSSAVNRVLEKLRTRRAAQQLHTRKLYSQHGIIGCSKGMREVFGAIEKAAATSASVLIAGESGTGKELVARAIHYGSSRASAPIVPINCGAIPSELVESELFGHLKGAFTSATDSRAGFFQTADGGSIFLDEISETSMSTQVKLLRVLQDKEIYMVGSSRPTKVDVRILSSTNKNLQTMIKKGLFREDLYFRLSVINISIPPLRERNDDILLLANHFVRKYAEEAGKAVPEFSDRVLEVLKCHPWPGNVREIENLMQQLVIMKDGPVIDVQDLPSHMRFAVSRGAGFHRTLADVEAEHIKNVLASVKGNKTRSAQILGIDRKTLREKLKNIQKD